MSPNYGSSKFFVSVLGILCATVLALLDKNVPEVVLSAAIVGYHAANTLIKRRNGDG